MNLSLEEFGLLTPGMFQALCKRKNIAINYERYANALTASAVYNVNRHDPETPIITAFDFVRSQEDAEKLETIRHAKVHINKVIGSLPIGTTRERYLQARTDVINDLSGSGYSNAEELFDECWPHLTPTSTEV